MLPKETIEQIQTTLGIQDNALVTAFEAEEVKSVDLPEVKVFTPEQLTEREDTLKTNLRQAGLEIGLKEFSKAKGWEQVKNINALLELHKTDVLKEADIKPNEKLQQKESMIEELRGKLTALESEKSAIENTYSQKTKTLEIESYLSSLIPDKLEGNFTKKDYLALLKSDYSFDQSEDGKMIIKDKDGKLMQDELLNNVDPSTEVKTWFENKYKPVEQEPARGRANEPKPSVSSVAGITNKAEFNEYCTAEGISSNEDRANLLVEIRKDNPDFFL